MQTIKTQMKILYTEFSSGVHKYSMYILSNPVIGLSHRYGKKKIKLKKE
jgi:hypothetical protein